jgi:hypothetical protein
MGSENALIAAPTGATEAPVVIITLASSREGPAPGASELVDAVALKRETVSILTERIRELRGRT